MIKVSIIIPHYNREDLLLQCLDSIANNDYSQDNYEVIVVDDCSTSPVDEALKYSKIKNYKFNQLDFNSGGASHPRNVGIVASTGTYALFIDSDDTISPGFLTTAMNIAQESNCDSVIVKKISERGSAQGFKQLAENVALINIDDAGAWDGFVFSDNYAIGKLFKIDILRRFNIRFPEYLKKAEDVIFSKIFWLVSNTVGICATENYYLRPAEADGLSQINMDPYAYDFLCGFLQELFNFPDAFAPLHKKARIVNIILRRHYVQRLLESSEYKTNIQKNCLKYFLVVKSMHQIKTEAKSFINKIIHHEPQNNIMEDDHKNSLKLIEAYHNFTEILSTVKKDHVIAMAVADTPINRNYNDVVDFKEIGAHPALKYRQSFIFVSDHNHIVYDEKSYDALSFEYDTAFGIISITSNNYKNGSSACIMLNGESILNIKRGIAIVVLTPNGDVIEKCVFDFYGEMICISQNNNQNKLIKNVLSLCEDVLCFFDDAQQESVAIPVLSNAQLGEQNKNGLYLINIMNTKARSLGMTQTVFSNVHGLADKVQTSTARDMFTMLMASLSYEEIKKVLACKEHSVLVKGDNRRTIVVKPTFMESLPYWNSGLDAYTVVAEKTGNLKGFGESVDASNFLCVSRKEETNEYVVGIVMGASSINARYITMKDLLESTFTNTMLPNDADVSCISSKIIYSKNMPYGSILEYNADTQYSPASLVMLMAAMATIDALKILDKKIHHNIAVRERDLVPGEEFVQKGDILSFIDVLYLGIIAGSCSAMKAMARVLNRELSVYHAKEARKMMTGKFIGIAGAVGKTSTKTMLSHVLSHFGSTICTPESANSTNAFCTTMSTGYKNPDFAVFEVNSHILAPGWNGFHAKLLSPDMVVLTQICLEHADELETETEFDAAKMNASLAEYIKPNGYCLYPADMPTSDYIKNILIDYGATPVSYGFGEHADIQITHHIMHDDYSEIEATVFNNDVRYAIPVLGEGIALNSLAVLGAVSCMGYDVQEAARYISASPFNAHRQDIKTLPVGNGTARIINDCFNAQPASVVDSIRLLKKMKNNGRKIGVLGSIRTFNTEKLMSGYESLVDIINDANMDYIILIGEIRTIANKLAGDKIIFQFENREDAILHVKKIADMITADDLVLVKVSSAGNESDNLAIKLINQLNVL